MITEFSVWDSESHILLEYELKMNFWRLSELSTWFLQLHTCIIPFLLLMWQNTKCSDLKQFKCIIRVLEVWGPNGSHWAKIKSCQAVSLFGGHLKENLFSCLFRLLEGALIPWLMALFLFKDRNHNILTSASIVTFPFLTLNSPASLFPGIRTWASLVEAFILSPTPPFNFVGRHLMEGRHLKCRGAPHFTNVFPHCPSSWNRSK